MRLTVSLGLPLLFEIHRFLHEDLRYHAAVSEPGYQERSSVKNSCILVALAGRRFLVASLQLREGVTERSASDWNVLSKNSISCWPSNRVLGPGSGRRRLRTISAICVFDTEEKTDMRTSRTHIGSGRPERYS